MRFLGIDIGSTTSKCVLLEDGQIAATSLVDSGVGTAGAGEAISRVLEPAGLGFDELDASAVTGYGRRSFEGAGFAPSELTCHALGASRLAPGIRTVIDIGGQDAKVILLSPQGRMTDFRMNDKCAAGTGRFLEVMARLLRLSLEELDALALTAPAPAAISSTCTVFAESEVISQLSAGADRAAVAAGIFRLAAVRTAALAKGGGFEKPVFFSGGCSRSRTLAKQLSQELGCPVQTHALSQFAGALGAAIYASEHSKS